MQLNPKSCSFDYFKITINKHNSFNCLLVDFTYEGLILMSPFTNKKALWSMKKPLFTE